MNYSKYHNKRTTVNGITFDSRKEAQRYAELCLLQRAGKVKEIERQVRYEIIPKIGKERAAYYVADFVYKEKQGDIWCSVVEDVKGAKTDVYRLKRKLMLWRHGIEIKEI